MKVYFRGTRIVTIDGDDISLYQYHDWLGRYGKVKIHPSVVSEYTGHTLIKETDLLYMRETMNFISQTESITTYLTVFATYKQVFK